MHSIPSVFGHVATGKCCDVGLACCSEGGCCPVGYLLRRNWLPSQCSGVLACTFYPRNLRRSLQTCSGGIAACSTHPSYCARVEAAAVRMFIPRTALRTVTVYADCAETSVRPA